jgi:hypothetical protein
MEMLQGEIWSGFIYVLLDNFGAIVVLSMLFWLVLHLFYERGILGAWPPSHLSIRLVIWILFLFPFIIGFGIVGLLLLIGTLVPALETQSLLLIDTLMYSTYLSVLVLASLVFFRVLRWCWKRYGTTGVMVIVSIATFTILIINSLGLGYYFGHPLIYTGWYLWTYMSLVEICWIHEKMKPRIERKADHSATISGTSIELATKRIYGVLVPLARRIKIDQDEDAFWTMQSMLQMDGSHEEMFSLACKALGFNRKDIINAPDVEHASLALRDLAVDWGNFSKLELVALLLLIASWMVSSVLTAWAYIGQAVKQNFVPVMLFFTLPLAVIAVLSLTSRWSPDMEYDLAKRHDEPFRFTQREYDARRAFDQVVLAITLIMATCIGALIIVFGDSSLTYIVTLSLSFEYILSAILLSLDSFMLGKGISKEETMAAIQRKLDESILSASKTVGLSDHLKREGHKL